MLPRDLPASPGAGPEPAAVLTLQGARALAVVALVFGAAAVLVSALQLGLTDHAGAVARSRLVAGSVLLAGSVLGWTLVRGGRARAGALAVATSFALGVLWHGWNTGLGQHNLALVGLALMLALMGSLLGPRSATALMALYLGVLAVLVAAEVRGLIPGRALLATLSNTGRAVGLVMVGLGAWAVALAVHRVLDRALRDARREQHRLAELLRIGSDWAWELDRRGAIAWLSPTFEARTGRTVEEFRAFAQPGGPRFDDPAQLAAVRAALRRHEPFRDVDLSVRCADGGVLHARTSGEPLRDADGRPAGWWGVCRNVTPEVEALRRLERERAIVDRLVQLGPDAICVVDTRNGRILLASPSFVALVGRPAADLVGKSARELGLWKDPDDDRRLAAALAQAEGTLRDWRIRAVDGRGVERDVLISAAAFERDGRPAAVLSVRDITEAERARIEADAILDHAGVGIALVRDQRFERVNPLLEQLLGHAFGSLAGQPAQRVLGEDGEAAQAAHAQGRTFDTEREVRRADGRVLTLRVRSRAIDPRAPREGGTIWVVEDVGERRAYEAALARAQRDAEAASHAKSAFLATMSHEIRTPLNGVLGLARLLQDERDEQRRGDYLQHLVGAAEGLAALVSDVLDLSKIEAGRVALEHLEFDLHALLEAAFNTFAPLGRERGLAMTLRLAPDVPRQAVGDPMRVRQVVSNYLNNALKFTPRGSIELALTRPAAPGTFDARDVRIEVRDSGIGIDAGARDRLFEPFSQADSSTTRRFGGTGLGLSICRELAVLMGGRVGAVSRLGEGSTFWVELPLALPETAAVPDAAHARAPAAAPRVLDGLRVLVAEDNAVNMLIVRALLERLGAQVIEASNGAQAVTAARAALPALDAVLMDVHMPVQDGLAAARELRASPVSAALPLIALSAAVLEQDRQEARAAGLNEFIAKPVAEADLLRVLGPLVGAARARERAALT